MEVLKLTPSHLKLLCGLEESLGRGLKRLIVGGEALSTELAREAQGRSGAGWK